MQFQFKLQYRKVKDKFYIEMNFNFRQIIGFSIYASIDLKKIIVTLQKSRITRNSTNFKKF